MHRTRREEGPPAQIVKKKKTLCTAPKSNFIRMRLRNCLVLLLLVATGLPSGNTLAQGAWTLESSLDWTPSADWDFHLQTPRAHIYYRNLSADGFTLNHDANAGCDEEENPPELITGTGGFGTYNLYSHLYSECGGSPPVTFEATVTVNEDLMINGVAHMAGQTFSPQDGVPFTVRRPYVVVIDPGHGGTQYVGTGPCRSSPNNAVWPPIWGAGEGYGAGIRGQSQPTARYRGV